MTVVSCELSVELHRCNLRISYGHRILHQIPLGYFRWWQPLNFRDG